MVQEFLSHSLPVFLFFLVTVAALGLAFYIEKHRK
jgi:hypothetical protein